MGQFKRHFICFTLLVSVYKHFWNYHWSNSGTDTFLQFNSKQVKADLSSIRFSSFYISFHRPWIFLAIMFQAAARCLLNNICALKSRAHMIRIDIHRIDQISFLS
ncbi:PREDICTED: uncharacterized protein LOC109116911 isoform X2 [Tarenaya hassleriana]|uniref:uncharacterized protein LOC109116911 isoform X2 n=1 Tax=Tarenaya hassleriana TaxID=28532 RepID=UPI0008FCFC4E|nr:PREDICTED: uncharacterized protein LOC109116911 isoform X2 [Tarenaya hassleriana]